MTPTSAAAFTVVVAVELLFPVLLSNVADDTEAVLLSDDPLTADADTFATSVNVAVAPDASEAIVHVTGLALLQLKAGPLFCVTETNVSPAGSVSAQATVCAVDGPPFETVTV